MEEYKPSIIVVDDESDIRKVIRLLLENKGYSVLEATNGKEAVDTVRNNNADLVIMDIMMPGMSGIEATTEIRSFSTVPVLFLTAKSLESSKWEAYTTGGDDYVVKPFYPAELLMKVDSLIRRYTRYKGKSENGTQGLVRLPCSVEVDPAEKIVYKNGKTVDLRDREADIFFLLLDRRGEVIEANTIYSEVWGEIPLSSSANNVMVNMLNLRRKLEDDPSNPRIIKTVWGRGYQFVGK